MATHKMGSSTLNTAKAKDFESMTMRDATGRFRHLNVVPGLIGPKAVEKLGELGSDTPRLLISLANTFFLGVTTI
jgi:hypothetical protein